MERANAGDVDGLVALYEPDAVLALPDGQVATGTAEIREVYRQLLADRPTLTPGPQRPALRNGELALTSTRIPTGATTEIARRHGATAHQIALAWLLRRSPLMLPIPGTLSIAHLQQNLAAADIELSDEEYASLL